MASDNHDTLVYRLAQMLVKLNQGEKLDPGALADEFGVNLRTIQRDLNERFAYASVSPYKLLNLKGIWYLAALDGDKLKTFSFAKIEKLKLLDATFAWSKEVDIKLATEDGIWFTETQHEVVLKVSADVAGYFKRRKLIANQVIEKKLADGDLLISAKVGHPNQVLPIVRYWIPHIRIISPEAWQQDLEQGLSEYAKRASKALLS